MKKKHRKKKVVKKTSKYYAGAEFERSPSPEDLPIPYKLLSELNRSRNNLHKEKNNPVKQTVLPTKN